MCYVAQGLIARGKKAGENMLAELGEYLLSNGMMDELQKALSDEDAREKMYEKYGIDTTIEISSKLEPASV